MNERVTLDRRSLLTVATGIGATTLAGCTENAATYREWGDVDAITLEGHTDGWRGVDPDNIDGEENPALVLYENQKYEITLRNEDRAPHSFEIRDENGAITEDITTGVIEEGETQTLHIRGRPWMTEYVCTVHTRTVYGDIDVNPENSNDRFGHDE